MFNFRFVLIVMIAILTVRDEFMHNGWGEPNAVAIAVLVIIVLSVIAGIVRRVRKRSTTKPNTPGES